MMISMPWDYKIWWELTTGCNKVTEGCKNCVAEVCNDLKQMGVPRYKNGFNFTLHESELIKLKHFRAKRCFVSISDMSDLFHPDVPDEFIIKVFNIIKNNPQHFFKIATKGSKKLMEISHKLPFPIPKNTIIGVSVESPDYYYRIEDLCDTVSNGQKGIQIAPLINMMPDLPLKGIDVVTCCDERGSNARPFDPMWISQIAWQCREAKVRFENFCGWELLDPIKVYRAAMILQLIEPTNGLFAFPGNYYPKSAQLIQLFKDLQDLPLGDLKALVNRVAPEFFK